MATNVGRIAGTSSRGGRTATDSQCREHRQPEHKNNRDGWRTGLRRREKINGRKRQILVDTLGLLLAVVVTQAKLDDAAAAPLLFNDLRPEKLPRLEVVWADGKYHNHELNAWLENFQPTW